MAREGGLERKRGCRWGGEGGKGWRQRGREWVEGKMGEGRRRGAGNFSVERRVEEAGKHLYHNFWNLLFKGNQGSIER